MNPDSLSDPQLQELEGRLVALDLQPSPAQRQQLLYRCAFVAGQKAAKRTLRRWQAAVAALGALLAGMTLSLARGEPQLAKRDTTPSTRANASERIPAEVEIPSIALRGAISTSFDAWQSNHSAAASFDEDLARFTRSDPRLRSFSAGASTREFLE
jgi:hypothetical protein